jgi:hypothetical protein
MAPPITDEELIARYGPHLIAVTVPAVLVSALVLGSRCERQIRARRTFDTAGHPWVLSDVATEPHRGIGNQLLAKV